MARGDRFALPSILIWPLWRFSKTPSIETKLLWDTSMLSMLGSSLNESSSEVNLFDDKLARACGVPAVGVRAVDCWQ